ncbi:hypothetical protein BH23BAC3_BH23BAC3_32230 [soil metagenome]
MSSEKGKVRSEKSPLEGSAGAERRRGVFSSLFQVCEKSPFEGGRVPAAVGARGMICGEIKLKTGLETESTLMESSPQSKRSTRLHTPPSKGDEITPLPEWNVQRNQTGGAERRPDAFIGRCVDEALNNDHTHLRRFFPTKYTPQSSLPDESGRTRARGSLAPKLYQSLAALILILTLFTAPVFGQNYNIDTPLNLPLLGETYPQLEEYLRIAVEENPELRSLNYLYRAEMERSREVGVLPDPELSIKYDFNPMMPESQLGRFSVSAMQMFPWFGSLGTMRDAQRSAAEADRAQIDVRQLEILRDLQITWFDIAEVQEQIRITEQNIELVQELIPLVEIRYETGGAGQADILRIQMEEQRLKNRIANLEDQLNPLKAELNEFLNRDPDAQVETTDSLQPQTIQYSDEQIRELVISQNPTFDAILARESSLIQQIKVAQLGGRPSIGLGLEVMGRDFGPMSMNPNSTESFIGMATIRLPIFRSRTQSQQRQVAERLTALEFDRHQTENRLTTEVERVLEEVRKSERNIHLLDEELVPRAQQAFTILSEAYSVGNARFDELLQIQRELLELEIERVDALAGQNRAVVRLESLIGNSPPLKGERREEGGSGG